MGAAVPSTSSENSQQLVVPSRSFAFEVTGDIICPGFVQGIDHLRDPRLNKVDLCFFFLFSLFSQSTGKKRFDVFFSLQGLAFTLEERQVLGIHGLQPARFKSQEEQIELCKISINRYQEDLNKYLYLIDLQVSDDFTISVKRMISPFVNTKMPHHSHRIEMSVYFTDLYLKM